jgi:hypothetical protein
MMNGITYWYRNSNRHTKYHVPYLSEFNRALCGVKLISPAFTTTTESRDDIVIQRLPFCESCLKKVYGKQKS